MTNQSEPPANTPETPATEAPATDASPSEPSATDSPAAEVPASTEEPKAPVVRIPGVAPAREKPTALVDANPGLNVQTPSSPGGSGGRDRRGGRGGPGGNRGGQGGNRGGQGDRRGRGGQRRGDRDRNAPAETDGPNYIEKVVHINRCAKVVKGGRRFSFAALVVVGDGEGKVGVGYGKAKEVQDCIRKGNEQAQKRMSPIALRNNTIPHEVIGEHDGGRVLLRPATDGTGVIAGGGVRAVLESCGVKNVLSKSLGSNNPQAVVFATLDALKQLRSAETIRQIRAKTPEPETVEA